MRTIAGTARASPSAASASSAAMRTSRVASPSRDNSGTTARDSPMRPSTSAARWRTPAASSSSRPVSATAVRLPSVGGSLPSATTAASRTSCSPSPSARSNVSTARTASLRRLVRARPLQHRSERLGRGRAQARIGIAERHRQPRHRLERRDGARSTSAACARTSASASPSARNEQRPRLVDADQASSLSTASRRRDASGAFSSLATASMLENRSPPPRARPAQRRQERDERAVHAQSLRRVAARSAR